MYGFGPLQQQWYTPGRGRWYIADQVINEWRYRMVTVFRTEVLEALRRMSGENFGFDRGEWQNWYAAQQQQP